MDGNMDEILDTHHEKNPVEDDDERSSEKNPVEEDAGTKSEKDSVEEAGDSSSEKNATEDDDDSSSKNTDEEGADEKSSEKNPDEDDEDDDEVRTSKKRRIEEDEEKSSESSDNDIIDDEDDMPERPPQQPSDFDIMMAKKKEENSRRRKRRNYDIINDNDDIIADIINQMREAMEADREANENKQAATHKLNLLPFVMNQLRKVDLRDAFLDSDVLTHITEWLAPLPDRSLPHLNIRESLLKVLSDLNLYDVDRIKSSGIGKAVMYLYKHPKETKENKQRAKQLISCWSRPIFQLDSSFTAISREEREQRDLELMNKQRRLSGQNDSEGERGPSTSGRSKTGAKEDTAPKAHKPGDKGWIPRARVPAPSMRDYVIRPRSKVDGDVGKNTRRPANMLEKYMKSQQERRRAGRQQRAVNMKIDRV